MAHDLHRMTREALEKLLAESGHQLSLSDHKNIAALDALARRVADPEDDYEKSLLAAPVFAGDTPLYPITMGAALWIEERALVWFDQDTILGNLAVAYALHLGKTPGALWELQTKKETIKAIKKWWRTAGFNMDELSLAFKQILPPQSDEGDTREKTEYGPVISLLCREYGATPFYWIWESPVKQITMLLNQYEAKVSAEHEANWKAARKAGNTDVPAPYRLTRNLMNYKNALKFLGEEWTHGRQESKNKNIA